VFHAAVWSSADGSEWQGRNLAATEGTANGVVAAGPDAIVFGEAPKPGNTDYPLKPLVWASSDLTHWESSTLVGEARDFAVTLAAGSAGAALATADFAVGTYLWIGRPGS
jgi:hypothetical protein